MLLITINQAHITGNKINMGAKDIEIKKEIISLNKSILEASKYKYDLRTLPGGLLEISTQNNHLGNMDINSMINFGGLPGVELRMPDETRDKLINLADLLSKNPNQAQIVLNQILTRSILYIGSECESYGRINVENEYVALTTNIQSKFISINRVDTPTIPNLITEWGKHKSQIVIISCHGTEYGLHLQDEHGKCEIYSNNSFYKFFQKRSEYIECVILSSCESIELGKQIKEIINNVICINRQIDIATATAYNRNFFIYLDNHSLKNNHVYEDAHKYSLEIIGFEARPDCFAFEFIKADKIP